MIREKQIREGIRRLKLSGLPVCLHSSLRSLGGVAGGAQAVIDSFLAEECTLMVPTFSDIFAVPPPPDIRPARNGWDYESYCGNSSGLDRTFEPESNDVSVEDMGVLSASLLAHPDRIRGNHPLCSFSAVGIYAEKLILCQSASDVFAPLRILSEIAGEVLLMGVGLNRMTLIHAAEKVAGRQPFVRWAKDRAGLPVGVRVGGCSDGFENLRATLAPWSDTTEVGASHWEAFSARPSLHAAASAIQDDPMVTHCGKPGCERCEDAVAGGPLTRTSGQPDAIGNEGHHGAD